MTESGGSILELFAEDAQVYFPKWGVATGRDEIGRMFGDVGATIKSILHDYDTFNYVMTGHATPSRSRGPAPASTATAHGERASRSTGRVAGATSSRSVTA